MNARYYKQNFYWWISEDDVLWWTDRYLYSEWLDVTWHSEYIQLTKEATEVVDTWSWIWELLLELQSPTTDDRNIVCFTDAWVFREWTVWAISSNVRTTCNFVIQDKVYFVKDNWPTSAYTLYEEDLITVYSWTLTETVVTTTTALPTADYDWYRKGALVIWDIAFMWMWRYISRFQPNWPSWNDNDVYDLTWDDIIWITRLGWYYRIYTKTWKLMLWDWNTNDIIESVNLNINLESVYQIWNIDYVYAWELGWLNKWLYYMNWFDIVKLYWETSSNALWLQKFDFDYTYPTHFTNTWKTLFWIVDNWTAPRMYKYWNNIQWLPAAYSEFWKFSSYWNEITTIKALIYSRWYIYYAYSDWTNYWLDKIGIEATWYREAEWTLYTNINAMWNWLLKKTVKALYFRVWDVDADRTIKVYMSLDWWTYNLMHTVNTQPLDWIVRIPLQWDFRDIWFKFVLEVWISTTTSPKIYYWIAIDYEEHNI